MEEIELIPYWVNWNFVEYDIFLSYKYDLVDKFIEERFTYINVDDFSYPIISKLLRRFYQNFNSEQPFYLENEVLAKVTNMEEYWLEYSIGFTEGFNSFEMKIQKESSVDYVKQILFSRLEEPFDFSFLSFSFNSIGKTLDLNSFYKVGLESGEIYSCWSKIIKGRSLFKDIVTELYSDLLPFFKHHHTNNDFRSISEFPINKDIETLKFKDILRPQYLEGDKYERFIGKLKDNHVDLSMPFVNLDGVWNFSNVQVLRIFYSLKEKKILNNQILDKDAKRTIAFEFGVPFSSIEKKSKGDIGNSGEALKIQHKIDYLINKIFLDQ